MELRDFSQLPGYPIFFPQLSFSCQQNQNTNSTTKVTGGATTHSTLHIQVKVILTVIKYQIKYDLYHTHIMTLHIQYIAQYITHYTLPCGNPVYTKWGSVTLTIHQPAVLPSAWRKAIWTSCVKFNTTMKIG